MHVCKNSAGPFLYNSEQTAKIYGLNQRHEVHENACNRQQLLIDQNNPEMLVCNPQTPMVKYPTPWHTPLKIRFLGINLRHEV